MLKKVWIKKWRIHNEDVQKVANQIVRFSMLRLHQITCIYFYMLPIIFNNF